jgi:hypothetical protein
MMKDAFLQMMSSFQKDFMDLAKEYLTMYGQDAAQGWELGDAESKAEEVKEGYYDPYYEEEEQDTLMLDEEGSVGTDENEMFPENDYYEESDININDPAFYSGKSLGLPKAVSVWGTPRGMPDTQLPVAKQKSHVGMPINLTLNFTTRGNVDSLLPTMSGMFAEPGEE